MMSRILVLSLIFCGIVTLSKPLSLASQNSRRTKAAYPSRLSWINWSGSSYLQGSSQLSSSGRTGQTGNSWTGSSQSQMTAGGGGGAASGGRTAAGGPGYQRDNPDQYPSNSHSWKKRLASCKNGNRFLKKKIKTMKLKYKEKLQSIRKIVSELFDDALDDPTAPLNDFCVVKNDVVKTSGEAPLNDGDGEKSQEDEEPCELSPWGEWKTLAFDTIERTRVILKEGCGCPTSTGLVERVDIRPYLGNTTSQVFQNLQSVGNNFDNDFLSGVFNGNGNGNSNGNGNGNGSGTGTGSQNGNGNGQGNGNGGSFNNNNNNNNNGNGNGNGGSNGNGQTGTNSNRGRVRDILMVLDSSGSIDSDDFDFMKEGLISMVDLFCDGFGHQDTNNRLAIVQFASNVTIIHYFRESQRPADLKSKVMNLRHYKGNTCTGNALKKSMREIFTTGNGMRDFTIKDTLIVTDGQSNCGVNITKAALGLQQTSNVYALGVGIAGNARARSEVKSVVSNENPRHIFSLAKFQDFKSMVENLKRRHERHDPCAPIEEP